MIQLWMMDELKRELSHLKWTIGQYTASDHTGTVYYEGGRSPAKTETRMRLPNFMVWIRSSDWEYAEYAAQKTFDLFHMRGQDGRFEIQIEQEVKDEVWRERYLVFLMSAIQDPIDMGVVDNINTWSINFDVELIKLEEAI
ncbi:MULTISPECIES: hypothetical protein [Bacillaceae]|uniref:Phage tail protein n=1 Tax=Alkalicoccobacillus plakortidis TaxID=444060 RepID=A0A9D5DUW6_9BACI|nr:MULTISPECIES: hypothetical protein [Bacillaceae]KQL57235.1 hypothetical protein AN965_09800 [Alkalicoccobacillus plakortidis]